MQDKVNVIS